MRKMMSKEVTFTQLKLAKMEINEFNLPVAVVLEDEILMGSVSIEKAQKHINTKYDNVTIYQSFEFTNTYVMEVEEFIKYATIKNADEVIEEEEQE